ncbi:MAG: hypothetical protein ABIO88_13975 [Burkholderiaceae bacterium]
MPISACYLFKNYYQHLPAADVDRIPDKVRGLYVLFKKTGEHMNVVYIGLARGDKAGAKSRLRDHRSNEEKRDEWSHFSLFEVWDNISKQQVEELEGLFRHIYAMDEHANPFNVQKNYKPFSSIVVSPIALKAKRQRGAA